MNHRLQHLVPGALVLCLAASVAWLSFTREPADAFLFPRLISVAMLVLASWNFARAALGLARVGQGVSMASLARLAPGLVIMSFYVFWLAKWLGFYAASLLVFFALVSVYDPSPHTRFASWARRAVISVVFLAVVYALFAVLLKVQTPRGLFI